MKKCLKILPIDFAPWFIIPADDKWYTRLMLANIIVNEMDKLDLSFPVLQRPAEKGPGRIQKNS